MAVTNGPSRWRLEPIRHRVCLACLTGPIRQSSCEGIHVEFSQGRYSKQQPRGRGGAPAVSRRCRLKAAGTQPVAYLFLNSEEAAFVEAPHRGLIPDDDNGRGVKGGVPSYIDKQLAGLCSSLGWCFIFVFMPRGSIG